MAFGERSRPSLLDGFSAVPFNSAHVSAIDSGFSFNVIWRLFSKFKHVLLKCVKQNTLCSSFRKNSCWADFCAVSVFMSELFFRCVFCFWDCEWLLLKLQVYCTIYRYNIPHSRWCFSFTNTNNLTDWTLNK